MKPAKLDLTVYQRATLRKRFRFPFDCTGYEVKSQIWSAYRVKKLVDFEAEWIDRVDGRVDIVADFNKTQFNAKGAQWDLLLIYPNLERRFWVEGGIIVDPGFTEPSNV